MSDLHLCLPDDFEMCGRCTGTGKVNCTACARGYCSFCGGTGFVRCPDCGGTGSRLIPARNRDQEETEESSDNDLDNDEVVVPTLEQIKADSEVQYEILRDDAERERNSLILWVWDAEAFPADFKASLTKWLSDLPLDHPDSPRWLNETADMYDGSTLPAKYGTLRMRLRGLSGTCSSAIFFKSLIG